MEINKLDQNAQIAKKSVSGSAGYDLYCIQKKYSVIPLGIMINIPKAYFGKIYSRSAMSLLRDIDIFAGVINSQYHGGIKLIIKKRPKILWSIFQKLGMNSICKLFSVTPYGEIKI